MGIAGAAIGAGVGLLGDIAGSLFSASQGKKARKHQEKMYRHRYQWAREDLIAAGLNPILAAGATPGAQGASTSAQASRSSGHGKEFAEIRAVNSAAAKARSEKQTLDEMRPWLVRDAHNKQITSAAEAQIESIRGQIAGTPAGTAALHGQFIAPKVPFAGVASTAAGWIKDMLGRHNKTAAKP